MSGTCNRCGRILKNPFYIGLGYGRICAEKSGLTITSGAHMKQQKKQKLNCKENSNQIRLFDEAGELLEKEMV